MARPHSLTRDCPATIIPAGEVISLSAGTAVSIVQTLGGHVTVRTDRGLFRIAQENTAAIAGYRPLPAPTGAEPAGEFSEGAVWDALRTCFDPEIPVNIVDLGLIYDVQHDDAGNVVVKMTLTTQGCPSALAIPEQVKLRIGTIEEVRDVQVELVWEPPWNPSMISPAGRQALGLEV
jgi:probable FeS assembly SUF system protein SufT